MYLIKQLEMGTTEIKEVSIKKLKLLKLKPQNKRVSISILNKK